MLLKSKLTKNIWFQDNLYELLDVISPDETHDFLIIKNDNRTICIDAHNEIFCLNTNDIKDIMLKRQERLIQKRNEDRIISESWLSCIKDTHNPLNKIKEKINELTREKR